MTTNFRLLRHRFTPSRMYLGSFLRAFCGSLGESCIDYLIVNTVLCNIGSFLKCFRIKTLTHKYVQELTFEHLGRLTSDSFQINRTKFKHLFNIFYTLLGISEDLGTLIHYEGPFNIPLFGTFVLEWHIRNVSNTLRTSMTHIVAHNIPHNHRKFNAPKL